MTPKQHQFAREVVLGKSHLHLYFIKAFADNLNRIFPAK
jgi:hypothetical protein